MRHLLIRRWPTKQAPSSTGRSKCHSNGGSSSTPKGAHSRGERCSCQSTCQNRLACCSRTLGHRLEVPLAHQRNEERKSLMENTNELNVVVVHGGWVDGSGWEGVHNILTRDGHRVSIVQIPTLSLADDVMATRRVIDAQDGPVILVGHSYGGAVITEAGNDPKVAGLVYITAFALDNGESVSALIKDPPPGAPVPPILPPQAGFLFLDKAKFPASFAADVDPGKAAFMADSQVPWGVEALSGTVSTAAWRNKPSWYLVVTDDKMIPPPAQRFMSKRAGSTVVEVPGSHAIYVSQPAAVADLIKTASKGA